MARDKLSPEVRKARHHWLKPLVAKHADGDLQKFAEKVHIDRSTVSQLYHDRREVTDKYAIRISNYLRIDPPKDMALHGVVENAPSGNVAAEPPAPYGTRPASTDREAQLLAMVDRLTATVERLSIQLETKNEELAQALGRTVQQRERSEGGHRARSAS